MALLAGMKRCPNPKCRAWNLIASVGNIDEYTELLGSGKIHVKTPRIVTGLADGIFGGGIALTSVNLISGEPGAGKTTLSLQWSNEFCRQFWPREAAYIANEQAYEEIDDTADRLGLEFARGEKRKIRIIKAMGGVNFDIGAVLQHYKPCLLILDSLTKWVGGDLELAVKIAYQLKDVAVLLKCPIMIVNQVTKDDDHAGLKKLQHAVDMTCMFDILEGEQDADGNPIPKPLSPRRLASDKNRFGPAPEEQFFQMTEKGLIPTELEPI